MFLHTDTSDAPWTVIKSDCKKARALNAIRYLLTRLPYAKKYCAGDRQGRYADRRPRVAGGRACEEFTPSSDA